MSIRFWPPLQLLTSAKIAQGILYTFDLKILKYGFMPIGRAHNYIQQIEEKVSSIILPVTSNTEPTNSTDEQKEKFLPKEVQKKIVGIVMTLTLEIVNWFECHKNIIFNDNLYLRDRLAWYSTGIIDRFETARIFIEDGSLSIQESFHLAFKYYLKNHIVTLWEGMSFDEKSYFAKYDWSHNFIRYWMIQKSISIDWSRISHDTSGQDFFRENILGLRYYFTKIKDSERRFQCILSALKNEKVHHFDLYSMLSRLDVDELNAAFTRLPSKEIYRIFECFLHWPFQIIFMDVVNQFRVHVTKEIFLDLIRFIFYEKVQEAWQDYEYRDILKHLWYSMPVQHRRYVHKDGTLDQIISLLRHSYS